MGSRVSILEINGNEGGRADHQIRRAQANNDNYSLPSVLARIIY